MASTDETVAPAPRTPLGVMVAACVSTLIVNANTSAVTILLPAISDDVGTPVSTLQWAVTGYLLVGAACIVTSGSLGDVFGRRRVFVGGLVLFIASCGFIALSSSGLAIILGRCIQGASGATLLASGLSLITIASPGEAQLRAVSYWGSASAIGAAVGPLLGGGLVDSFGWQALFWIDAAIAVVLVPLTVLTVSESSDPSRDRSIDWLGTVLIAMVLAPFILAVTVRLAGLRHQHLGEVLGVVENPVLPQHHPLLAPPWADGLPLRLEQPQLAGFGGHRFGVVHGHRAHHVAVGGISHRDGVGFRFNCGHRTVLPVLSL